MVFRKEAEKHFRSFRTRNEDVGRFLQHGSGGIVKLTLGRNNQRWQFHPTVLFFLMTVYEHALQKSTAPGSNYIRVCQWQMFGNSYTACSSSRHVLPLPHQNKSETIMPPLKLSHRKLQSTPPPHPHHLASSTYVTTKSCAVLQSVCIISPTSEGHDRSHVCSTQTQKVNHT